MTLTLQTVRHKMLAIVVIALAALTVSSLFSVKHAHAASLGVVEATTTSSNASTTLAKVGDTVHFGLRLTGTPTTATSSVMINIFGMGSTSMSGSGAFWFYSTTSSSTWTNGPVQFNMAWNGTVGDATTTVTQATSTGPIVRFDKSAPLFATSTSASCTGAGGKCKVGDTITFTITPTATEYGASITSSYNGHSLTWSTANAGVSYTATYTVTEGDTDHGTALQMSDIVLTDAAGNPSVTGATTDVTATIDANSPSTPTASPSSTSFTGSTNVSLSSANSDSIHYTTDGSLPTCSTGSTYSSAISINSTETLKVVGCDTAGNISSVASFTYTKHSSGGGSISTSLPPQASPVAGIASGKGLASNQIQSILSLLSSFGADQTVINNVSAVLNGGKNGPNPGIIPLIALTKDLTVGSSGGDVTALQKFLNNHGFTIASSGPGSPGSETMTFGALTKAALAKFQAAHGITPAVGFLGPKTRALLNSMSQ